MKEIYINTNDYDLEEEVWKPIEGWENVYEVSSQGRVRSLDREMTYGKGTRITKGKVLKIKTTKRGYIHVGLCKKQRVKWILVHRLVAEAFIPNPENKPQVNHINGVKNNNWVNNLEWCTISENLKHAYANGYRSQNGEKNHRSKLTSELVIKIRKLREEGWTQQAIADITDVSREQIRQVVNKKSWKHI